MFESCTIYKVEKLQHVKYYTTSYEYDLICIMPQEYWLGAYTLNIQQKNKEPRCG